MAPRCSPHCTARTPHIIQLTCQYGGLRGYLWAKGSISIYLKSVTLEIMRPGAESPLCVSGLLSAFQLKEDDITVRRLRNNTSKWCHLSFHQFKKGREYTSAVQDQVNTGTIDAEKHEVTWKRGFIRIAKNGTRLIFRPMNYSLEKKEKKNTHAPKLWFVHGLTINWFFFLPFHVPIIWRYHHFERSNRSALTINWGGRRF